MIRRAKTAWLRCTAIVVTLLGVVAPSTAASAAPTATASRAAPVLAADYFGEADPYNFWSSDLATAGADFQQIKANGFTAVGLAVSWGDFEPGLTPVRYNPGAFARLRSLVALANSMHLQVILRLSYGVDINPQDQMTPNGRLIDVLGNDRIYSAWLDYLAKVRATVSRYHNVRMAYLAWEDWFGPVLDARSATALNDRVALARATGFTSWLRGRYSLSKVSSMYHTRFTSWAQVPVPPSTTPAFELMYQYDDWALVHRIFAGAAARFPGLTLESRVDLDPVNQGARTVSKYSYTDQFDLQGTPFTGIYFSPYMGDPSTSPNETTSQALTALTTTLSSMHRRAKGQSLYIYEYEIYSNSPEISGAPQLPPGQLPAFVAQSLPVLRKYTLGYSVWTYRDFNLSPVYNPSFALGSAGWTMQGAAQTGHQTDGSSYLALGQGASAAQAVSTGTASVGSPRDVSLTFQGAGTSGTGRLQISVGGTPPQTVVVRPGWHSYEVNVPTAELGNGQIALRALSPTQVSDVQLYGFTQYGDLYSTTGAPGVALGPLQAVNHQFVQEGISTSARSRA